MEAVSFLLWLVTLGLYFNFVVKHAFRFAKTLRRRQQSKVEWGAELDLLEQGEPLERIMLRGGWQTDSTAMSYLRNWIV